MCNNINNNINNNNDNNENDSNINVLMCNNNIIMKWIKK